MNRVVSLVLSSAVCAVSAAAVPALAADSNPCLQKRAAILEQIDQAQQRGNQRRVAGLNKALREQEANCTPESLRQAHEQDLADAREEVAERERALQQARSDGKDARKIARLQAKLQEARDDLAQAEKSLAD